MSITAPAPSTGRFGDVYDPTAGTVAARVELAGRADVERAIASSGHAFDAWSKRSALSRARILVRYREILEANADRIARACIVQRGIEVVEFAIERRSHRPSHRRRDHHRKRHAAFARGAIPRAHQGVRRRVEIGIGHHDRVILAPPIDCTRLPLADAVA